MKLFNHISKDISYEDIIQLDGAFSVVHLGYQKKSIISQKIEKMEDWVEFDGVLAQAFPFNVKDKSVSAFDIEGTIKEVSDMFNKGKKESPFGNAGLMIDRHVYSVDADPFYDGPIQTLGNILVDEDFVPEEFFISDEDLPKWKYEKGAKKINRVSKEGFEYVFSEGGMAFPDYLDKPSRTMITGEGGNAPSRFKHVIQTPSGRYRRLIPIELERLNMFPDNHTLHLVVFLVDPTCVHELFVRSSLLNPTGSKDYDLIGAAKSREPVGFCFLYSSPVNLISQIRHSIYRSS